MLKGGVTNGQQAPYGMHVTTEVYGKAVKLAFGLTLVAPDLIWYNDWGTSDSPVNPDLFTVTGGSSKKKSSGKKSNTTYYYCALNMVLAHSPILAVLSIWYNNQKFDCAITHTTAIASGGIVTFAAEGTLVAGVIAATVNETYTATFNDYGGTGPATYSGTWDVPLWNTNFAVPGRITSDAFNLRDPYSFSYDGLSNTIGVPPELNGKEVTVYYSVPQILKSNGQFYTAQQTPLGLLSLEFEEQCGSGSEYVKHPQQQIINSWCSGVGSPKFDLSAANSIPNLNMECIGSYTLWPNGDCDVVDVITDIVNSGPVLIGEG